jgi:hypothetical protein
MVQLCDPQINIGFYALLYICILVLLVRTK